MEECADRAKKSPGTAEEFGDDTKEAVVRAEPEIDLFLDTNAFAVAREGNRITEGIRDWNLRAVFGEWSAVKNGDGAAKHPNAAPTSRAYLAWFTGASCRQSRICC